ncbi:MAG: hypothetical protein AMXMBFR76_22170 [Pseudomonadota bacterium]
MIPAFAGAGRRVMKTFCPECKPTPVARMVFFNVRCLSMLLPTVAPALHPNGEPQPRESEPRSTAKLAEYTRTP